MFTMAVKTPPLTNEDLRRRILLYRAFAANALTMNFRARSIGRAELYETRLRQRGYKLDNKTNIIPIAS